MGLGSLFKRNKKDKKEEKVDESHIDIDIGSCDGCEKCVVETAKSAWQYVQTTALQ